MLHVTNGTSVSLTESGLAGDVVFWVDVLHEGPVPAGLNLYELSRCAPISGRRVAAPTPPHGFAAAATVTLAVSRSTTRSRLWFEHDLYDQLQLIQILDWFHGRETGPARLSLICVDRYLGRLTGPATCGVVARTAHGDGRRTGTGRARVAGLPRARPGRHRRTAAPGHRRPPIPGRRAPGAALQQFPSTENGLARTERQILEAVEAGPLAFPALFQADQQREERIFMGDCTLYGYAQGLVTCPKPLLGLSDGVYQLTETGRDVLSAKADHIRLNGIDRWFGGVHLIGAEAAWRWDNLGRKYVKKA